MAAEIDEGEEVLPADAEGDDDGEEEAASVDELGLPMPVLSVDDALSLLREGELELVGRLWASTNNAMLCVARRGELEAACIYKPVMGERPLGDFPDYTLARREVAAFTVSRATGWEIVPPTVLRDGPFGEGMVQLWIRADDTVDPVALVVNEDPRLRRMAAFDAAVNNTDRKAGHLVPVPGGHVYGVDHGVTFSPVPKLRTVLWTWRGQPFSDEELRRAPRAAARAGRGARGRAARAPRPDRGGGHEPAHRPAARGGRVSAARSTVARAPLAAGLRRVPEPTASRRASATHVGVNSRPRARSWVPNPAGFAVRSARRPRI